MFSGFSALSGYRRIVDFLGGQSDNGLYILNSCLNFYPNGNVGTCPYFVPGNFYLLSLVRDGASNTISIYVNGASFGSYSDAANNYVPAAATTPIVFFRDNIASSAQCENSDGSIKYLSISPLASTAVEVNTVWTNICAIVLPVNLSNFTGSKINSGIQLSWTTTDETNIVRYEVERRGGDNLNFTVLGSVAAANLSMNQYHYTDLKPLAGAGYYRLRITDVNGIYKYSSVLKFDTNEQPGMQLYPNPASGPVVVSGIMEKGTISLYNNMGILLKTFQAAGNVMSIPMNSYPSGIYIIAYSTGGKTQRQRLVKY